MPIVTIAGPDAITTMKANPEAQWPKRNGSTRVVPVAKPGFVPAFSLTPGDTVFTIGSCFARNVERSLKDRGFRLPALDVLEADPEFQTVGSRVLNNYGVPSILNELRWAFANEDDIDETALFTQMGNGWVDLHLHNTMRPTELETLRLRRRAIRAAYRSIAECKAVIITLGLSEVWFDTQTGYYLNMAPRRAMLRSDPDRFELHVLSYDETRDMLTRAVELIRDHGAPGIQVLLTVSPIPLTATYRDQDVMVANTYSKSVLRTAVEEIVQAHDFVGYYPSFESITLSPRPDVYLEDEVHVTQEIIDLNIGRMVTAYTGTEEELTEAEALAQLDTWIARPKLGFEKLTQNIELCRNPEIATALMECAIGVDRLDVADAALPLAEDPTGIREAMLFMARGHSAKALAVLKSRPEGRLLGKYFGLKIRANAALGRHDHAAAAARDWAAETPNALAPHKVLAEAMAEAGQTEAAEAAYARAVRVSDGAPHLVLDYAEFLFRAGKAEAARAQLEGLRAGSDRDERRRRRLLEAC